MADGMHLYHYDLPPHLIAQRPIPGRDQSRLMLLRRGREGAAHHVFTDLPGLLPAGCVLVVNNTRVMPRRLPGRLPGGGRIDALLVEEEAPGRWRAMIRNARRIKPGMELSFAAGHIPASAVERTGDGQWRLAFHDPGTLPQRLERHGLAPLPPYIRRDAHHDGPPAPGAGDATASLHRADREDYQTIFATVGGAIAAPTAGFHFTPRVLQDLERRGIERAEVTLHVGIGTFAKIEHDDPARHEMHREWFHVPADTIARIAAARADGRPVVAVGTTTVRALETWAAEGAPEGPEGFRGWSRLFIRPPYAYQVVEGLITNFHQPRTTLMLMVAAFHGRERLLAAYREAVAREYRFFSYGDCMAILPPPGA